MKNSRLEEDKNIAENKDMKNLFILKKLREETNDAAIKGIRNKKKKIKQLKT